MRIFLLLVCAAVLAGQTASETTATLTVDGDVASPITLTAADLAKMPRESAALSEPDGTKIAYEGVPLIEILKKAGIPFRHEMRGKALAGYVLAGAHDGYQVVFSLGELDPDTAAAHAIVADRRDGQPLTGNQGPLRLVVSTDKRPARSVRMLETLHVVKLRK